MNTRTVPDRATSSVWLCALEPPGNIARDISLHRRRFFQEFGISSACMYPALVALNVSPQPTSREVAARACLDAVHAIEDRNLEFEGSTYVFADDSLYLGLETEHPGWSGLLEDATSGYLGSVSGNVIPNSHFLLPGAGFFVCRTDGPGDFPAADTLPSPIRLFFRDCSVSLYRVDSGDGFRHASHWTLLARARRKTGPRR